jgi:hypothetical protein
MSNYMMQSNIHIFGLASVTDGSRNENPHQRTSKS